MKYPVGMKQTCGRPPADLADFRQISKGLKGCSFSTPSLPIASGFQKASVSPSNIIFLKTLPVDNLPSSAQCSEAVPVAAWLLSVLPLANVSPGCPPPAAESAEVAGPRSNSRGLPDRAVSQPGRLLVVQDKTGSFLMSVHVTLTFSLSVCLFVCVVAPGGEPQSHRRRA